MIRIKTQKVLGWEIFFKWPFFLTVLPIAEFRTQPKVYGGAPLQKYLTTFSNS